MPFEDYLPKTLPPWLRKQWGQAFHVAVGRRMDAVAENFRQAIFARMPTVAASNEDDAALEAIGHDRQLPRGPGESAQAYGDRLYLAWEAWAGDDTPSTGVGGGAGSPLGMLNAIKAAGLPTGPDGATIVQQNGRYAQLDLSGALALGDLMDCVNRQTLDGSTLTRPGWTFDGRDNFYSVFGIVFPTPATIEPALLNTAVEQWRPSKALYVGAWIIESGTLLGWPATGRTLGTEPALGGNVTTFVPGAKRDDLRIGYYAI